MKGCDELSIQTTNNTLKQYTAMLHRHVDSYGNSICEEINNELKQVVDREIILEQVPHPHLGITVVYPEKNIIDGSVINRILIEVDVKDSINNASEIKIDYNTGRITTHYSLEGKFLNVSYWGRGWNVIHSSRVYTKLDEYGDVCQTLDELIDIIYKLGSTDYIVNILQDIENTKVSVVNGVTYTELNERLNAIENRIKDFLNNILNLDTKVETVKVQVQTTVDLVNDVNYRMQVLENNYLNPKLILNSEIDTILGRLT